ncbi:hypothetical protein HYX12_03805 [Candidatus Woesearchaeota archaeon]|nr:hypothetical protein [Candidatus Woesearchaeota archaeon]
MLYLNTGDFTTLLTGVPPALFLDWSNTPQLAPVGVSFEVLGSFLSEMLSYF